VTAASGVPGRLYCHLFARTDGSQILLLWDKTSDPTVRLELQHPGTSAVEIRLDGQRAAYPHFRGTRLDDVHLTPGVVRIFEISPY